MTRRILLCSLVLVSMLVCAQCFQLTLTAYNFNIGTSGEPRRIDTRIEYIRNGHAVGGAWFDFSPNGLAPLGYKIDGISLTGASDQNPGAIYVILEDAGNNNQEFAVCNMAGRNNWGALSTQACVISPNFMRHINDLGGLDNFHLTMRFVGTSHSHGYLMNFYNLNVFFSAVEAEPEPEPVHLPIEITSCASSQVLELDSSCQVAVPSMIEDLEYTTEGESETIEQLPPAGTLLSLSAEDSLDVVDVLFTATDEFGSDTCQSYVTLVDHHAPTISSATAFPDVLSPPNHKMVEVSVDISASDACSGDVWCRITGVIDSHPDDPSNHNFTWGILSDTTLLLKAAHKGEDRLYTVEFTCEDDSFNLATGQVTVTVPK